MQISHHSLSCCNGKKWVLIHILNLPLNLGSFPWPYMNWNQAKIIQIENCSLYELLRSTLVIFFAWLEVIFWLLNVVWDPGKLFWHNWKITYVKFFFQDVKGPQTVAFNLPNDERIVNQRGTCMVMLKNVSEAKYSSVSFFYFLGREGMHFAKSLPAIYTFFFFENAPVFILCLKKNIILE